MRDAMTLGRLAVIPARGGSKRIPRKNVRPLDGRPMIAYTVEAALESGLFARVVVSTDSEEIAAAATEAGAEVPFLRAAQLADDVTPVSEATADALDRLDPDARLYDAVAQLMPNCPLRTAGDIRESFSAFRAAGSHSQLSVTRFGWQNPWWAMRLGEGRELQPVFETVVTSRSQDLPELFCPTGAIWWAKAATLRRTRTFHVPGRTGWEIPWQHGVDIDTEDDWAMAETLLAQQAAEHRSGR
ncbi:MAG TPA: acylneuraminate cytidylyltransferase family protein [Gemmatimonadales bacterium]|jgi:N-acylneuraminate cytidylyltransferase